MSELPDHVARNRRFWNDYAPKWVEAGRDDWAATEPRWGNWRVPESEVGLLPDDLEGKDAIELGCGTAYLSAWLARRGAKPVGIDNSGRSWRRHGASSGSSGSSSRCCTATPRKCPTRTPPSTSRSPSTGRASGPIPTAGSRRRAGCSGNGLVYQSPGGY